MINAFIDILIADATVRTTCGRNKDDDTWKVYPVVCPEKEKDPYVTVSQEAHQPEDCKEGATTYNGSINVNCYARNYDDAESIANAVKSALDRKADGVYGGHHISEIRYTNMVDRFSNEAQLYVKVVSFDYVYEGETT